MSDRGFVMAFGVSLGIHVALLAVQCWSFEWLRSPKVTHALEVVYQYELATRELAALQAQLAGAARQPPAAPAPTPSAESWQVRVLDRPAVAGMPQTPSLSFERPSIVDLTNLVSAAQGNPVLLGYFSVLREQIQRAANSRTWVTGDGQEGVVYVSFLLTSTGAIREVMVVPERSVPPPALREIALRIVSAAAPFPPFPPSLQEPSKTIIVPLEFSPD